MTNETDRIRAALELTREHNRKLVAENARLRAQAPPDPGGIVENGRLREQVVSLQEEITHLQRQLLEFRSREPIAVKVHPDLLPPPPAPKTRRQVRRGKHCYAYAGDQPLRSQWPVES
jgi:hypothetical protein